jgi:ribose-phosphate pyrophosphokinase
MTPLMFCLNPPASLAHALRSPGIAEQGACEVRHFPDGESYVRVASDCRDRDAFILCSLVPPDPFLVPLLFLAATLRELGARSVGLIAPYLPYMRQDQRFRDGEAVGARLFANTLSAAFDWLIAVDPHLHRCADLAQLYPIPHRVVTAAPALAQWIRSEVRQPLLVGPDAESEQWVAQVARATGAPFVVLDKIRRGDRDVVVTGPALARWAGHTPVLLDDMISTGHTLLQAAALLQAAGLGAPVCVAVHGLFVDDALPRLHGAGIDRIATANTVSHSTNAIDVGADIAAALVALRVGPRRPVHRSDP